MSFLSAWVYDSAFVGTEAFQSRLRLSLFDFKTSSTKADILKAYKGTGNIDLHLYIQLSSWVVSIKSSEAQSLSNVSFSNYYNAKIGEKVFVLWVNGPNSSFMPFKDIHRGYDVR